MNDRNPEIPSLEALLSALSGNAMSPAAMLLSLHPFKQLDDESIALWNENLEEMKKIDPTEIDSVFISVLHRKKGGEWCEECQVVHENDGYTQTVLRLGEESVIKAGIMCGMDECDRRQSSRKATRVMQPAPNTEQ